MDLRLGDYREVLRDVTVGCVLADPPYGARTHAGTTEAVVERFSATLKTALCYTHWTQQDVADFVAFWSPRACGWMACMTSHDLIPAWEQAYIDAGRLAFAPVPIIQDRVRMGGDGPASGAIYLMVARPRRKEFLSWGALPGWYKAGTDRNGHIGGKPLDLMRSLVRDYSRPGDLVCDPCAGGGTTLLAAAQTGRRAIGAELDPVTHAKALKRLANTPVTTDWLDTVPKAEQGGLW